MVKVARDSHFFQSSRGGPPEVSQPVKTITAILLQPQYSGPYYNTAMLLLLSHVQCPQTDGPHSGASCCLLSMPIAPLCCLTEHSAQYEQRENTLVRREGELKRLYLTDVQRHAQTIVGAAWLLLFAGSGSCLPRRIGSPLTRFRPPGAILLSICRESTATDRPTLGHWSSA